MAVIDFVGALAHISGANIHTEQLRLVIKNLMGDAKRILDENHHKWNKLDGDEITELMGQLLNGIPANVTLERGDIDLSAPNRADEFQIYSGFLGGDIDNGFNIKITMEPHDVIPNVFVYIYR